MLFLYLSPSTLLVLIWYGFNRIQWCVSFTYVYIRMLNTRQWTSLRVLSTPYVYVGRRNAALEINLHTYLRLYSNLILLCFLMKFSIIVRLEIYLGALKKLVSSMSCITLLLPAIFGKSWNMKNSFSSMYIRRCSSTGYRMSGISVRVIKVVYKNLFPCVTWMFTLAYI